MFNRKIVALFAIIAVGLFAAGCDTDGSDNPDASRRDSKQSQSMLAQYQKSQPVPRWDWSQMRQTLIDIRTAQAETTRTTSFFFSGGAIDPENGPIMSCPSIGFAIPDTYQLTSPDAIEYSDWGNVTYGQMEPTGIFSGDSTGTYVVCIADDGSNYVARWEGFVFTVSGPAEWDRENGTVKMTGKSTINVQTK